MALLAFMWLWGQLRARKKITFTGGSQKAKDSRARTGQLVKVIFLRALNAATVKVDCCDRVFSTTRGGCLRDALRSGGGIPPARSSCPLLNTLPCLRKRTFPGVSHINFEPPKPKKLKGTPRRLRGHGVLFPSVFSHLRGGFLRARRLVVPASGKWPARHSGPPTQGPSLFTSSQGSF